MRDEIDARDLGFFDSRGIRIDAGGNAVLTFCTYRGTPYLFKRFTQEHRAQVDEHALLRLIRWRAGLAPDERAGLDAVAAWPRYLVRLGARVDGVLVPPAPPGFFAMSRSHMRTPRGLTELDGAAPGSPAPSGTIAVLGHLITVVRDLHERGVVVNDLQPDNVLCAPEPPSPGVYLVDCDSMVSGQHWGQVAAPAAPDLMNEVQPTSQHPTIATDLHKLMWTVVRVLLEEPTQVGLGPSDRALLAAAVPPDSAGLLIHLLGSPGDAVAWDRLARQWSAVTAPVTARPMLPAAPAVPYRRRSWLPADYAYQPDPCPPVLPARLRHENRLDALRAALRPPRLRRSY